jgi:protein-disulfide isomerase
MVMTVPRGQEALVCIRSVVAAFAIAWLGGATLPAAASPAAVEVQRLTQEVEKLRTAYIGMQEEIRQVKALLQQLSIPAAASPVAGTEHSLEGAQFKGSPRARVVLAEYSDFHCPFCASHVTGSYRQITREYVDTGRLRYAFMSFPIETLHPLAFRAHLAAACAADEGRFWEMHDRLFADARTVDADALAGLASGIGLDRVRFRSCLDGQRHADALRRMIGAGQRLGINGTPTFVIGVIGADEKFRVATIIVGAKPYPVFKQAIDSVLAGQSAVSDEALRSRPAVMSSGPDAVGR